MLCNGFRSALRPNSATAKGETEYSKVHNIEVQHAKYRITQYRNTLHNIQNTETQQIHYSIGSRSASRPNSATANGETEYSKIYIVEVQHAKYSSTQIQNTGTLKYVKRFTYLFNGFSSALRSNSTTANSETGYSKTHIVFVEVEHAK